VQSLHRGYVKIINRKMPPSATYLVLGRLARRPLFAHKLRTYKRNVEPVDYLLKIAALCLLQAKRERGNDNRETDEGSAAKRQRVPDEATTAEVVNGASSQPVQLPLPMPLQPPVQVGPACERTPQSHLCLALCVC
jgi:hypothetical protein